MATPVWTTTAGKIATIDEQVAYSLQLEANTSDSTAITYSVIAGSLPAGMQVTSTGLLTGTPAEVAKRTLYTFVVRATAGTQITDRTFSLDVQGADAPVFTTAAGQLQLDDSTRVGLYWVLDGEYVNFQLQATDVDTREGASLKYQITSGILPAGLTLSESGLLSGTCRLTDDYFEDSTRQIAMTFPITVRVDDGTSFTTQENNIFVYSADYWRVSNTLITVDMTEIHSTPLTMDFSANRRPIFKTASNLGTFRHDNQVVIKIDVEDLDPLQGDLQYSIQSGALPTGLSIDTSTGEIYGQLARQAAVEVDYSFTIRVSRTVSSGVTVYSDQAFTMKVIGEIDIGIAFTTPTIIGTLTADIPCTLDIQAVAEQTGRVLSYSVTSGTLPTGITLSEKGNLIGTIDPSDFTDSTRSFTFTVTVSDQYQEEATSKEFTLNINIPYTQTEYGNMTGHATSFIDQNIFYNIAQDPNINSPAYIYRPEDSNFGMRVKPDMLMMAGVEAQTLTTFQEQMESNHAPITLWFGNIKTAVAKQNGTPIYEVVYIDMIDPFVNNDGIETGNTTMRPNAVENMRDRIKALGHREWDYLPLWMKTTQAGDLAPLGYVKAVPICYCQPGAAALIKKRIEDKSLNFKNIAFTIDRYQVSKSKVSPEEFTADGSTTTFELNEIVHEQDILVLEGTSQVYVGNGVTADNSIDPTWLTADNTLRSSDHEYGIELTHDTVNNKTTINFTKEVPNAGTIIRVERLNDKYLRFRDIT
jgi:hypothetical protein